ncbi:4727_t:CDS:2, partial [Scutellospora calospora]
TRAKEQLEICMEDLKERPWIHLEACEQILLLILENSLGDKETCVNQYDIRDYSDKYPSCGMSWPYDLTTVSTYLRRADVIGAIHASKQKIGWIECNNGVGRGFDYDPSPPAVQNLTEKNWFVNDKPAGHVLSERRLTYVVVNNASHMVPYDQPEASMAMMYWFIGINNQVAANLSYKFGFESNAKASTPISDINGTIADSGDNEILDRYYNA